MLLCTDALARAQLTQFAEGELPTGLTPQWQPRHYSSIFQDCGPLTCSVLLTAQQSSKCDAMKLKKKKTIHMIFQHGNETGVALSLL